MKAYLFVETGEVRNPNSTEWFMSNTGNPMQGGGCFYGDRNILTRREIEIPDKATRLTVIPERFIEGGCYGHSYDPTRVPIPRPKKRVKKWLWIVGINRNSFFANTEHRTEEEIKATFPSQDWYHRIDETMKEVEE